MGSSKRLKVAHDAPHASKKDDDKAIPASDLSTEESATLEASSVQDGPEPADEPKTFKDLVS